MADEWKVTPITKQDPYGGNDWLLPSDQNKVITSTPSASKTPIASGMPALPTSNKSTPSAPSIPTGLTDSLKSGILGSLSSPSSSSMIPSANVSTSVASKSGDAQSPFDLSFQYNGAFQVGGSGSQTQDQAASQAGSGGSNILVYVAIGVSAFIALAAIINAKRSK